MSQRRFNGELARERRITLGFTVEQIAAHVGKSPKSIYAYESKRDVGPTPPVRLKLEAVYELDAGELLTESDAKEVSREEGAHTP
jgi:transcriptional regulator with XRE-family HTH domain